MQAGGLAMGQEIPNSDFKDHVGRMIKSVDSYRNRPVMKNKV